MSKNKFYKNREEEDFFFLNTHQRWKYKHLGKQA